MRSLFDRLEKFDPNSDTELRWTLVRAMCTLYWMNSGGQNNKAQDSQDEVFASLSLLVPENSHEIGHKKFNFLENPSHPLLSITDEQNFSLQIFITSLLGKFLLELNAENEAVTAKLGPIVELLKKFVKAGITQTSRPHRDFVMFQHLLWLFESKIGKGPLVQFTKSEKEEILNIFNEFVANMARTIWQHQPLQHSPYYSQLYSLQQLQQQKKLIAQDTGNDDNDEPVPIESKTSSDSSDSSFFGFHLQSNGLYHLLCSSSTSLLSSLLYTEQGYVSIEKRDSNANTVKNLVKILVQRNIQENFEKEGKGVENQGITNAHANWTISFVVFSQCLLAFQKVCGDPAKIQSALHPVLSLLHNSLLLSFSEKGIPDSSKEHAKKIDEFGKALSEECNDQKYSKLVQDHVSPIFAIFKEKCFTGMYKQQFLTILRRIYFGPLR